jgi:pimeloyl-ACP methyl ester carboxylesterase
MRRVSLLAMALAAACTARCASRSSSGAFEAMSASPFLAALEAGAKETAGDQSQTPPESTHEGRFISIGGVEHWITIRGNDIRNPVILMLHGGPGFPQSQWAPLFAPFEKDYTLVQWDQPGGGATYAKNIGKDIGALTVDRYRSDGIAVAEFVRDHLHANRMILYGTSWGTLLGIEMVRTRPDLFSAYVGVSQVAGPRGDLLGYQLALKAAQDRGDKKGVGDLQRVGPPPYGTFENYIVLKTYTNPPGLPPTPQEQEKMAGLMKLLTTPPDPNADYIAHGLPSYDGVKAFLDTSRAMFKQQEDWDPFKLHLSLKVPVLILNGDHDFNAPAQTAMELCQAISASQRHCEVIPGYGHGTIPNEIILDRMAKYVRPFVTK